MLDILKVYQVGAHPGVHSLSSEHQLSQGLDEDFGASLPILEKVSMFPLHHRFATSNFELQADEICAHLLVNS